MNTAMIWQTRSTSSAETERLGALLGSRLIGGEVIELRSDLGGGKTTFVKGLAIGAGSSANAASPTFTLNRVYSAKKFSIYHYDFYRLDDAGILADQLAETVNDSQAVVVVEWADIVNDVLPDNRLTVEFKPVADFLDERDVFITYPASNSGTIKQVESDWADSRP